MRTHEHSGTVDLDKGVTSEKERTLQTSEELWGSFGSVNIFKCSEVLWLPILLSRTEDSSVLWALAWKISNSVISLYFTNLHKSSYCTVCNKSLVENTPSGCAFVGNSASVPHIAPVGINTYHRCEQELTDMINEKQSVMSWICGPLRFYSSLGHVCDSGLQKIHT